VLNAVLVQQIVKAFARADGKRTVDRILTIGFVVSFVATDFGTAGADLAIDVTNVNDPANVVERPR